MVFCTFSGSKRHWSLIARGNSGDWAVGSCGDSMESYMILESGCGKHVMCSDTPTFLLSAYVNGLIPGSTFIGQRVGWLYLASEYINAFTRIYAGLIFWQTISLSGRSVSSECIDLIRCSSHLLSDPWLGGSDC